VNLTAGAASGKANAQGPPRPPLALARISGRVPGARASTT